MPPRAPAAATDIAAARSATRAASAKRPSERELGDEGAYERVAGSGRVDDVAPPARAGEWPRRPHPSRPVRPPRRASRSPARRFAEIIALAAASGSDSPDIVCASGRLGTRIGTSATSSSSKARAGAGLTTTRIPFAAARRAAASTASIRNLEVGQQHVAGARTRSRGGPTRPALHRLCHWRPTRRRSGSRPPHRRRSGRPR